MATRKQEQILFAHALVELINASCGRQPGSDLLLSQAIPSALKRCCRWGNPEDDRTTYDTAIRLISSGWKGGTSGAVDG